MTLESNLGVHLVNIPQKKKCHLVNTQTRKFSSPNSLKGVFLGAMTSVYLQVRSRTAPEESTVHTREKQPRRSVELVASCRAQGAASPDGDRRRGLLELYWREFDHLLSEPQVAEFGGSAWLVFSLTTNWGRLCRHRGHQGRQAQ